MSENHGPTEYSMQVDRITLLEEKLQFAHDALREAMREYRPTYTHNPNGRNPSIRQPDPQWVRMTKEILYGDPKAEPYP